MGGLHWRVKENDFPFPHTAVHLLIVARAHWTRLEEVTPEAWAELAPIMKRIGRAYGPPDGGFVVRTGSLRYSAGTVEHLHANLLAPDLTGPVRITIAKEVGDATASERERRFREFVKKLPEREAGFIHRNLGYPLSR